MFKQTEFSPGVQLKIPWGILVAGIHHRQAPRVGMKPGAGRIPC